ncbi:MAG TPA: disulfide bond formation protein B [Xanthomonadaceae bacterium]|jgi:disulfide bond formation protein DsbB|nr:disulfide bond formation protein B [Xanthomonadaceae bacterium]
MNANPLRWSYRARCLLGFLVCAALLAFALYMQLHGGLEPCPLCIFQRVAFASLGVVLLVAGLHAPRGRAGRGVYGVLALVAALGGVGIAGRHVWLQHLPPDQVPMCGPGLNYLMEAMPLTGVIRKVLTGSGECARVDWSFLGLSMPEWSLLWFVLLAAWVVLALFRRRRLA